MGHSLSLKLTAEVFPKPFSLLAIFDFLTPLSTRTLWLPVLPWLTNQQKKIESFWTITVYGKWVLILARVYSGQRRFQPWKFQVPFTFLDSSFHLFNGNLYFVEFSLCLMIFYCFVDKFWVCFVILISLWICKASSSVFLRMAFVCLILIFSP